MSSEYKLRAILFELQHLSSEIAAAPNRLSGEKVLHRIESLKAMIADVERHLTTPMARGTAVHGEEPGSEVLSETTKRVNPKGMDHPPPPQNSVEYAYHQLQAAPYATVPPPQHQHQWPLYPAHGQHLGPQQSPARRRTFVAQYGSIQHTTADNQYHPAYHSEEENNYESFNAWCRLALGPTTTPSCIHRGSTRQTPYPPLFPPVPGPYRRPKRIMDRRRYLNQQGKITVPGSEADVSDCY